MVDGHTVYLLCKHVIEEDIIAAVERVVERESVPEGILVYQRVFHERVCPGFNQFVGCSG